jgi:hypothetical protein
MKKHTNEDGEPIAPIYDTEGRLSAISQNCDDLLNGSPNPFHNRMCKRDRELAEGIKHLVKQLIESAGK